ncbi:c6 zinc finger domain containing protein [Grosmannia clavigera kw1407]|uniref:C6 zinc finger domain containing protein n=1 Tax=Grosmannia clavigera (strain kw1407 / UAMH 11150) TaxID=655863 RepID=F0XR18_GROCL|nr:c6 zinc finger domain containing protein [Grosmannia clavigera kw1407]EFW99820.1 c6 zinc finger domain containing protein [Grosmannia clavigera kw1407]
MGRAPKSGYCHTCRQRRVKCDKERPECQRCRRSGHQCQGYEAVLRMQSHAAVAGAAPGTLRLGKIQSMTSYPGGGTAVAARSRQKQAASSSPPAELSFAGFADDMAFSYFFQSYSWINMYSILLQDSSLRGCFEDGDMTGDSLRALCYGLLGRDKSIYMLQDAGRRAYGRAIRSLRTRMAATSKADMATLVKPISLMGSYAVAVDQDLRFTHHAGLAHVLEYCGPEQFQSAALLPVFESIRWTLISDAIVRRQGTFLEQAEWKTVPWAACPEAKSVTSKLLDVLAGLPTILQGVWGILADRSQWALVGGPRIEQPDTVPRLQVLVRHFEAGGEAWRREWEAAEPELAPRVLAWALFQAADDSYRPGVFGVQGPDVFDLSVATVDSDGVRLLDAQRDDASFERLARLMQDTALYATVLVWTTRLDRYLAGAARSASCIDFMAAPFRTRCTCCETPPMRPCETVPPAGVDGAARASPDMAWNVYTCVLAVSPLRIDPGGSAAGRLDSNELLPGDVRFVAQLRILAWLCSRLPASRSQVLGTLAAIGLGHCAHDVRPADGITEVAAVAVSRVFDSSDIDGAANVLLRRYGQSAPPITTQPRPTPSTAHMARRLLSATIGLVGLGLGLADQQACADQQFDPAQSVCHDDRVLCPIVAGEPLAHCSGVCYSRFMYVCTDNVLAPLPVLAAGTPFALTAANPSAPAVDGLAVSACALRWNLGGPLCAYCPADVIASCPVADRLVVSAAASAAAPYGMDVAVPGGQIVFLDAANNAVAYSQAHSAALPPGALLGGLVAYNGGGFVNLHADGWAWLACPPDDNTATGYSLHAASTTNKDFLANCTPVNLKVSVLPLGTVGAWQYT